MMEVLVALRIDWRDRRLVQELHTCQEAIVRVADGELQPCIVGRGIRQGFPLSPLLFSIYSEAMMKETMDSIEEGIRIGGELLKDVKFADDQGIVANSEQGLQRLLDSLTTTARIYDMKVNVKKTKTMKVSKLTLGIPNITIEGGIVEQVKKFRYLRFWITEDGRCETEVKSRIAYRMAIDAYRRRQEFFKRKMSLTLKKRIVKELVWSGALYECVKWTMKKDETQRLGIETIVNRKKNWIGQWTYSERRRTIKGCNRGKNEREENTRKKCLPLVR